MQIPTQQVWVGPEMGISNRLPEKAYVTGLQTTLGGAMNQELLKSPGGRTGLKLLEKPVKYPQHEQGGGGTTPEMAARPVNGRVSLCFFHFPGHTTLID